MLFLKKNLETCIAAILVISLVFGGGSWLSKRLRLSVEIFGLPEARAAVALVQTTNGKTGGNGGTSVDATFASTPISGNLLVAVAGAAGNTTLSMSASGWTQAIQNNGTTTQVIFYKIATSSEPTVITVNSTASLHMGLHIYEYSGVETNGPLEGTSSSTGNGTTTTSGSYTTIQPDTLLIAAFTILGQGTFGTYTNSFTKRNDLANNTGSQGRGTYTGGDRVVSATSTYSTAATSTVSGAWTGQLAAFRSNIGFTQSAFRWFTNVNASSVGPPLTPLQDQVVTVSDPGTAMRLRMLIHVSSSQLAVSNRSFKLQFANKGGGTCAAPSSTYADVTTSTAISYYDNSNVANGDSITPTSTDPQHGTDSLAYETYVEQNNFTNTKSAIAVGYDGLWDFPVVDNNASSGATYCLRAVETLNNLPLDSYGVYPQAILGNVGPSIDGGLILNGGNNIALLEGTTTLVSATATVSDPNGYTDLSTTTAVIYRTGSDYTCVPNNNNCYQIANCSFSSCAGTSCTATCSARIWYFAEPTDTSTPWADDTWSAWMHLTDKSATSTEAVSAPVEMLTTLGIAAGPINYGSMAPGGYIDLTQLQYVTSTGNSSLDIDLYGNNMVLGSSSISADAQHYSQFAGYLYGDGAVLASSSPGTFLDVNIPKPISTSSAASQSFYWGIQLPTPLRTGLYTRTNVFVGVVNTLPWP